MLKQYFSDGLVQIAILLSLLRTDLINFNVVPNNELLSYPEFQDILQGQTMAYVSTNIHNSYNTLNSIHGYYHPKHIESDFYFSSLFRELQRFRSGVPQNIEAFLVSSDASPAVTSPHQADVGQSLSVNSHDVPVLHGLGESSSQADFDHEVPLQNTGCSVVYQSQPSCADLSSNPFPECCLSKEDLELIEVLWRQDVDLGVGKEVFDPNLRRELEHERELEIRKEQEKRKLEEKHKRELQQQNEQWLLENFIRDGETGELIPIVGSGNNNNSSFSSSGPSTVYPESTYQAELLPGSFDLDESYHIDRTYVPQLQQTHAVDLPDSLLQLDSKSDEKQFNYSVDDSIPFQEDWDELISFLNGTLSDPSVTDLGTPDTFNTSSAATFASSLENPVHLMTEAVAPNTTAPQLYYNQQQYGELQPDMEEFFPLEEGDGSHLLTQSDLKESLHQLASESDQQSGVLAELLNQADMLLSNAALPVGEAMNTTSPLVGTVAPPVATDQGLQNLAKDLNSTTIAEDDGLTSDEWTRDIYPHLLDLANQTGSTDLFDSLPVLPTDVISNLDLIEDPGAGSDSAISVGSVSPQQDIFGTVDMLSPIQSLATIDMSPFEGLEGATGGSDIDSTNYAQHKSRSTPCSEDDGYNYSCSSYGSPASVNTNYSTGSNDTEHSSGHSSVSLDFVNHNHTYPTLPGNAPREVKKYIKKEGSRVKGPQSKDAKRAAELKIPYSIEQIIETPVEEFNNMLTKSTFTETQMNLMRDIRRRGKNKIAAQNCRKRKMDVIVDLSGEKDEIRSLHAQLSEKRHQMELEMKQAREMYSLLYKEIFASLRDEEGRPYDPSEYSLQHGADGNVFLVRLSKQTATTTVPIAVAPNTSHHLGSKSSGGTKRKNAPDLQKKKKE